MRIRTATAQNGGARVMKRDFAEYDLDDALLKWLVDVSSRTGHQNLESGV